MNLPARSSRSSKQAKTLILQEHKLKVYKQWSFLHLQVVLRSQPKPETINGHNACRAAHSEQLMKLLDSLTKA